MQLGRAKIATGVTQSLYSPPASTRAILSKLLIVDHGGGGANVTLYCDDDGSTYDNTTAIELKQVVSPGHAELPDEGGGWLAAMNNADGNFAVKNGGASDITLTLFGFEMTASAKGTEKMLGQVTPSDASATSLYSPTAGKTAIVMAIKIYMILASNYQLYYHDSGTTFDTTTQIVKDVTLSASTSDHWPKTGSIFIASDNRSSTNPSIGVQNTVGGTRATFTAFGIEFDE